jgi:signal peptidase II
MLIWTAVAGIIVVLDQLAKYWVINGIGNQVIRAIPGLINFVYVKNTGAAFSILSESTGILGIISILFCLGVLAYWYFRRPEHILMKTSLTLLFAGALGNAIDRIFRGYVVDFIETAFIDFPVFNVADIAITCGAVIMAIYIIFFDKDEKDGETDSSNIKSE